MPLCLILTVEILHELLLFLMSVSLQQCTHDPSGCLHLLIALRIRLHSLIYTPCTLFLRIDKFLCLTALFALCFTLCQALREFLRRQKLPVHLSVEHKDILHLLPVQTACHIPVFQFCRQCPGLHDIRHSLHTCQSFLRQEISVLINSACLQMHHQPSQDR